MCCCDSGIKIFFKILKYFVLKYLNKYIKYLSLVLSYYFDFCNNELVILDEGSFLIGKMMFYMESDYFLCMFLRSRGRVVDLELRRGFRR